MLEINIDTGYGEEGAIPPKKMSKSSIVSNSEIKPSEYITDEDIAIISTLVSIQTKESPFSHSDRFGCCEYFKLVFAIILIPIRIIILFIMILFIYPCMFLASRSCCGCNFNPKKSPNCLQKVVWKLYYPFSRIILWSFGVWWIGKKRGSKKLTAQVVVAAPHSSFLDGFLLGSIVGCYSGFAKKSVSKVPIVGTASKLARTILIDRSSPEVRAKSLSTYITRLTKESTSNPIKYVTFPEGTCTNRKSILDFRQGAFAANVPVQLVCLYWKSSGSFDVTWSTGGPNRFYLLLRLFMQPYTRVSYKISDVLEPEENESSQSVSKRTEQLASELLNIPTSTHTYTDSFLAKHAKTLGLNVDVVCDFALADFEEMGYKIPIKKAMKIMDRFSLCCGRIRTSRETFLDVVGFATYFHLPSSCANDIFLTILRQVRGYEGKRKDRSKTLKFRHVLGTMFLFSMRAEEAALSITEIEAGLRSIDSNIGTQLLEKWGEFFSTAENVDFLNENKEVLYVWSRVVLSQTSRRRNR